MLEVILDSEHDFDYWRTADSFSREDESEGGSGEEQEDEKMEEEKVEEEKVKEDNEEKLVADKEEISLRELAKGPMSALWEKQEDDYD